MIYRAYSIYDNAVNTFAPPFFVPHVQIAMRYFEALASDPKSDVSKWPSQFHLFELGEFDDAHGSLAIHTAPVSMGLASQFVKQEV